MNGFFNGSKFYALDSVDKVVPLPPEAILKIMHMPSRL